MGWNEKVLNPTEHYCKFPSYWSIKLHGGYANKSKGSTRRHRTWTCKVCSKSYEARGISFFAYTWREKK